jgi:FKBP-type peptidyl-prolyl cis-trans isomerase FkpA
MIALSQMDLPRLGQRTVRRLVALLLLSAWLVASAETSVADEGQANTVLKTSSGMAFKLIRSGTGPSPRATDTVKMHYRGSLANGQELFNTFQSGGPSELELRRMIPCWSEGLQLMQVGAKAQLTCPPGIAYGESGAGDVPPNATMLFELELLAIVRPNSIDADALDWRGWSSNPGRMRTKTVVEGSGPKATMRTTATVLVESWFFNVTAVDFKGRQPISHTDTYDCNPRAPRPMKGPRGAACEAVLNAHVGTKILVVPATFAKDGSPFQVIEVTLQSIGPEALGPLTLEEAEKVRINEIFGQTQQCDAIWKSRRAIAERDGLELHNGSDVLVMLSAYASADNCPTPGSKSFLLDPGHRALFANSPTYRPGIAYDRRRIAVQPTNPNTVTPDSLGAVQEDRRRIAVRPSRNTNFADSGNGGGANAMFREILPFLLEAAPLLQGLTLEPGPTGANLACRRDCELNHAEPWGLLQQCLASCIPLAR